MNIPFIKYLGEKLKIGNLRSIHLNALPNRYLTRLDLTRLDVLAELQKKTKTPALLSYQFVFDFLLKKEQFKFPISFKGIKKESLTPEEKKSLTYIERRLNALFNQDEDNFLEHGIRTFSFGYPLLIKRNSSDPKRITKAPIFIWSLDIHRSKTKQNEWTIVKTLDSPIYINEVLIAHINKDENITINNLHPEYLEDNIIDKFEVQDVISEILNHFRDFKGNIRPQIMPCLKTKDITEKSKEPFIMWSGVFGLFKTQKQSIIKDIEQLIETFDPKKIELTPTRNSKNTSVHTDPSQQEIIHSINKSTCKVIQGPPGTGKSQSITAIITNALENQQKILVVCEKKTALEVIENNLKDIGLGELCTTIDDVNRDRFKIIHHVRNLEKKGLSQNPYFNEIDYNNDLVQFDELTEEVNEKHNNLLKTVLNDRNTKHVIAEHLSLRQNGMEIQDIFDTIDFELTGKEYADLNLVVRKAKDLYEAVDSKAFLFDKYLSTSFLEKYAFTIEKEIFKNIEQVEDLAHQFIDSWEMLTFKERATAENYSIGNQRLTKFKSIFSKSNKMVIEHWEKTKGIYENIKQEFQKNKLSTLTTTWDETTENLTTIRDEIKELQLFTGETMMIKSLFRSYYYWRSFYENQPTTFQKVLQILTQTIPNTEDWLAVFKLEYLDLFLERKEIEIGPFNQNNHQLDKIWTLQQQLKQQQRYKILKFWAAAQQQAIKAYNQTNNLKWLFNYRKNTKYAKRNSLRKIIHEEFDLTTTLFPVLLVNPQVCSSIFPLKKGIFDLVIFDEASQLRLEDTFTAFYRGKVKIISGDNQQMPPSSYFSSDILLETNETIENTVETEEETQNINKNQPLFLAESESLLAFGNNLNAEFTNISYLDFHYRSKHPYLIDFSNVAFYGKRLVPMPSAVNYKPIRFFNVDGLYQHSMNHEEAKKVIELIREEIVPFEDGTYPSLGIATFNMTQRNIIKDLIYATVIQDETFRAKMEKINATDEWFVKNLENIQGDERDVIIISTTFGINANGRFIQNFGPLNNFEKGYKLLNVIITRAKRNLFVVTSIPENYYDGQYRSEIERRGNKGKAVLYAYLDYCRKIENEDEKGRRAILDLLLQYSGENEYYTPTIYEDKAITFEKIVVTYLKEYIEESRIVCNYSFGGYKIDIIIKDQNDEPQIAIECDGTDWHKTNEAYVYDLHRQQILENYGLKYYRLWSKKWWYSPEKEVLNLVEFIKKSK